MSSRDDRAPMAANASALSRAERLAQQRAERHAQRRARLRRPMDVIAAAVHAAVGVVQQKSANGARARQLAERRRVQHRRLRRATSAAIATLAVFGITAAYGFWSIDTGAGAASAKATTLQPLSAAVAGTVTSQLLPGGNADLHMRIANPNHFTVKITSIQQTPASSITVTGGIGTCNAANAGVSVSIAQPSLPVTITATNGATQDVDLAGGASMSASSATGCQQASFTIPVTVGVQQQ